MTKRFVFERGLPGSTTARLIDVQRDITERRDRLATTNLSAEERAAQVNALAQEASARLVAAIGSTGVSQLGEAGRWFRELQGPAATPSPP